MESQKVKNAESYPSESEGIAALRTCAYCKHWSGITAALPAGKGFCFLASRSAEYPATPNPLFNAPNGLITAPAFGCNQFTPE